MSLVDRLSPIAVYLSDDGAFVQKHVSYFNRGVESTARVTPEVEDQSLVAGVDDARQLLVEVPGRLFRELLDLQVGEVFDGRAILSGDLVCEYRRHLNRRTLYRYLFFRPVLVAD